MNTLKLTPLLSQFMRIEQGLNATMQAAFKESNDVPLGGLLQSHLRVAFFYAQVLARLIEKPSAAEYCRGLFKLYKRALGAYSENLLERFSSFRLYRTPIFLLSLA
jgi:hypothetical protein